MPSDYTSQNTRAWNEIAVARHSRTKPASYYRSGDTTLNPLLVEAAGDLTGQSCNVNVRRERKLFPGPSSVRKPRASTSARSR